jgi:iron complex outermembrane receptor protein
MLAVSSSLLFTALAHAQTPTLVTGTVTTKADGLPVPGATVSVAGHDLTAITDTAGKYTITVPADVAKGQSVEVRVIAGGLSPRSTHVTLSPGTITADFELSVGFHEEVTVGSRAPGTAAEKATPVDILTQQQIVSTGASETSQIIQALAPSFNFPRPTLSDGADTVRPATLRGLGPDQVLVLINGKRRHTSAHIPTSAVIGRGSTGVDLNAIPASAIQKIEVLRDGAAAQYGSDAIAGVVNIVLKSGPQPLTLAGKGGFTLGDFTNLQGESVEFKDGALTEGTTSYGWNVGRGSVFLAAEYRNRNGTNRASPDVRDQVLPGDAASNPVEQPNHHWGDSEQRDILGFFNASFPLDDADTRFFYAFGGWGRRDGSHGGFYRRALDARNWPSIHPLGFLPTIEPKVVDASGTVGARGVASGFFWDVSAQYGHNSFEFDVVNSLNTSLGPSVPPNQTSFYAGTLAFGQLVLNADVSREVEAGLAGPLNLAAGVEFRSENYEIQAGEPSSYADGRFRDQFGGVAPAGAQVFPGYRPSNEVDARRNNYAVYADVEGDVARRVRLGIAGRFEDYDNFESTDGKATLRVAAHERVVLRAAASTGFRAPSLAQSHFSTVSTNFINVGGVITPVEVGTFAVDSPIARALGSRDLEPEESVNLSAGIVLNPVDALDVTVDYYHIDIDRRIVFSGNFTGGRITEILAPFSANGARFFTNAIDTRTNGVDVAASYRVALADRGTATFTASYNHTRTKLVGTIETPPQLAGFENVLFDREQSLRVTCGQPEDNARLSASWLRRAFSGVVRVSRYGEYCFATNVAANDQTFSAEWTADLELAYQKDRYTLAIGGQNLFNAFPDRLSPSNSSFLVQTYPSTAPFGFNGRFLYARFSVRL